MYATNLVVSPRLYGAKGDGVADDTAALSAALNSGRPVWLDGVFRITSTITVNMSSTFRQLTILGGGPGTSQIHLNMTGVMNGIVINMAECAAPWGVATSFLKLQDFAFIVGGVITGAGLLVNGVAGATGSSMPTFDISNVHLIPVTTSHYTQYGFVFRNLRNGTISDCNIQGHPGWSGTQGGIQWESTASTPNSNPVDFHVRDCQVAWYQYGIDLVPSGTTNTADPDDWQGCLIQNCTILACDWGIRARTTDMFSAHLQVKGTHVNFGTYGISAVNIWDAVYADNNFMLTSAANSSVVAIDAYGNNNGWPMRGHIHNNTFNCFRSPAVSTAVFANVGSGGSPNGGAFTQVHNNTGWKQNAGSLNMVNLVGGTIYQSDNNFF